MNSSRRVARPPGRRLARRAMAAATAVVLAAGVGACTRPAPPPAPVSTSASAPATVGPHEPGWSQPRADPLYPDYGNPDLDVLAYRLVLAWDPPTRVLTGTATLTIRPTRDVTVLSLDFAGTYTVDGVTVDGIAATPHRSGNDIVVPTAGTVARDRRTTLVVRYHGTPKQVVFPSGRGDAAEGLGLRPTATGEAWTMQEPYGAATWYPANDHPSDEAVYDIAVTVPTGWAAIASGTPGEVTPTAAGLTYRYTSADPVATYLTTLAIGRYTRLTDTGPGGLPITYWLRTDRDEGFLPVVRKVPALLTWLSDHFGPYPFPTAGVVFVDSDSAMETQQMVTYGAKIREGVHDLDEVEEVILHELSHQWFGDAVTPTDWLGLWLNEGWAMYAEWLWTVDRNQLTDAAWVAYATHADQVSRTVAGPPGHPGAGHFGEENVYLGPALMLREIRRQVGDTEFFALARDWVQTQRNTAVDRAGFIAFVNRHTGRDLTALIDKWLDSPTTPRS